MFGNDAGNARIHLKIHFKQGKFIYTAPLYTAVVQSALQTRKYRNNSTFYLTRWRRIETRTWLKQCAG